MIRPQIDFEHPAASSLAATLESAAEFGLTAQEIWETVLAAPDHLPPELKESYLQELTGDLAKRLVEKQRTH